MHKSVIIIGLLALCVGSSVRAAEVDGTSKNIFLYDLNTDGRIETITFEIENPSFERWQLSGSFPHGISVQQRNTAIPIEQILIDDQEENPVKITIRLDEDALEDTGDGITTNPLEVAYSQSASGSINSVSYELNTITFGDFGAHEVERERVAPYLKEVYFEDRNGDGKIDTVVTTWSEPVSKAGVRAQHWKFEGDVPLLYAGIESFGGYQDVIEVYVHTTLVGTGTDTPLYITYLAASDGMHDASGNRAIESARTIIEDRSPPVMVRLEVLDANGDFVIEALRVTYSEQVVISDTGADTFYSVQAKGSSYALLGSNYTISGTSQTYLLDVGYGLRIDAPLTLRYEQGKPGTIRDTKNNYMRHGAQINYTPGAMITQAQLTPSTTKTGALSTYTLQFGLTQTVATAGELRIYLPAFFSVLSAASFNCEGVLAIASKRVQGTTIILQRFSNPPSLGNALYSCTFSMTNPTVVGTTGQVYFGLATENGGIIGVASMGALTFALDGTTPVPTEPTQQEPPSPTEPTGQEPWVHPQYREEIFTRFDQVYDAACESFYAPFIDADIITFNVGVSPLEKEWIITFVCYGHSLPTVALGSGERRAMIRDYFETAYASQVYWGDIYRMSIGQKIVQRNLTKEVAQIERVITTFEMLYNRRPAFGLDAEDLSWNTLMYRIRFVRNLEKERLGIGRFETQFDRLPTSPYDWALVRVYGYVQ